MIFFCLMFLREELLIISKVNHFLKEGILKYYDYLRQQVIIPSLSCLIWIIFTFLSDNSLQTRPFQSIKPFILPGLQPFAYWSQHHQVIHFSGSFALVFSTRLPLSYRSSFSMPKLFVSCWPWPLQVPVPSFPFGFASSLPISLHYQCYPLTSVLITTSSPSTLFLFFSSSNFEEFALNLVAFLGSELSKE